MKAAFATLLVSVFLLQTAQGQTRQGGKQPGKAAATTPEPTLIVDQGGLLEQMRAELIRSFELPEQLPLDPELRTALQGMAQAHLSHMDAVLPGWIAQAMTHPTPASGTATVAQRLRARLYNEQVLWRMEPMDAEHDAAWFDALQKPGACRAYTDRELYPFARYALILQLVPRDKRDAVLKGEKRLLANWGRTRAQLPEAPIRSIETQVQALATQVRLGRPGLAPMPPVLASLLLKEAAAQPARGWGRECLQAQWWLRQQPRDTAELRAAALLEFRYALATVWVRLFSGDAPDNDPDYPALARAFGVQGVVKLRHHLNAQGQLLSSEVIDRKITVPAIPDNPPLGLITLLDQAALNKARQGKWAPPDASLLKDGVWVIAQEFQFNLHD